MLHHWFVQDHFYFCNVLRHFIMTSSLRALYQKQSWYFKWFSLSEMFVSFTFKIKTFNSLGVYPAIIHWKYSKIFTSYLSTFVRMFVCIFNILLSHSVLFSWTKHFLKPFKSTKIWFQTMAWANVFNLAPKPRLRITGIAGKS